MKPRFTKPLTDKHFEFLNEKGSVFKSLWIKRVSSKRGMTNDMWELFDLIFDDWVATKKEKKEKYEQ